MSHLDRKVHWSPTGDPDRQWGVWIDGAQWELAVRDIQGQRRYALYISDKLQQEFSDWPQDWSRGPDDPMNAAQRAEYEREREYFEKNRDVLPVTEADLKD